MTRLEEVRKLRGRGKRKKSYAEIGKILGISRQRVHSVATGYEKRYRHSVVYKMYRRHSMQHLIGGKLRKPCTYCDKDRQELSMGFTRPTI